MLHKTVQLLVVEDNLAYLELIREAFLNCKGGYKWQLSVAHDGAEALAIIKQDARNNIAPDLILLDWHLPKVSGIEVLKELKAHEEFRKIPVLIFSSSDSQRDIHNAYGEHANGYITKPANLDALFEVAIAIEAFWIAIAQLALALTVPTVATPPRTEGRSV